MRTKSTIPITFDGVAILTPGGLYDGEEIRMPLSYTTEAVLAGLFVPRKCVHISLFRIAKKLQAFFLNDYFKLILL